jgi:hypothetical protein
VGVADVGAGAWGGLLASRIVQVPMGGLFYVERAADWVCPVGAFVFISTILISMISDKTDEDAASLSREPNQRDIPALQPPLIPVMNDESRQRNPVSFE